MNPLDPLTQTLKKWQHNAEGLSRHRTLKMIQDRSFQTASYLNRRIFSSKPLLTVHSPLMVGLAAASLTVLVGHRFYNQPQLAIGTRSPQTLLAPQDGRFEDPKTTEMKRKAVETNITPILRRDPTRTIELRVTITQTLEQIQQWRQQAGTLPFVEPAILSVEAQRYLRICPEEEWQAFQTAIQHSPNSLPAPIAADPTLKTLKNNSDLSQILIKIQQSRQKYQKFINVLPKDAITTLSESEILAFTHLSDSQWQHTQQETLDAVHRILTQGIYPGFPPHLLEETLHAHLDNRLPSEIEPTLYNLLIRNLAHQSNLIRDEQATRLVAQEASAAIQPAYVEIRRGEVIVSTGEIITPEAFVLLDGFGLSQRGVNGLGLGISGLLVTASVLGFSLVARRVCRGLRRRDHVLLLLLSLGTPILVSFNPRYLNLPLVGTLTSSFYHPSLAVTQVLLLGGLSAFASETVPWAYWLGGMAGGLLAASVAGKLRSRDELALLGVGVGVNQGGVYLFYHLLASAALGGSPILALLLPKAIFYGASGTVWTVLAIGLSPYLERIFDLVTPIRLVELSNPNGPLLKRLATEAPGTFQHTLFVSCLAEAAARELNCNVELVRAGTLYHDIGKMHDPLGFIENQMGVGNKHDQINDPFHSRDIIKKHVSEGLVMAKQYGLPQKIQNFIPEHQGTLLISYFYHQAKQRANEADKAQILEADFRYDGPIPQSRETAIVMLADGCEAALRSLEKATPETALALIQKIFKARWRDGQLQESGLTYEELPIIAEVFVRVWQQFHHKRIAYPNMGVK